MGDTDIEIDYIGIHRDKLCEVSAAVGKNDHLHDDIRGGPCHRRVRYRVTLHLPGDERPQFFWSCKKGVPVIVEQCLRDLTEAGRG